MALTSVVIPVSAPVPSIVGQLAAGTGNTAGFTFTLSSYASAVKVVSITGDADWYWSQSDSGTAAASSMQRVRAEQPLRIQVHTPVTIYAKTATGTSNLVVMLEY